jgi:glycerol-3-phosphate acyltransferase PlsY
MTHVFFPLAIIAAYLLGSIPFGLLIVKAHGKDLRSIGSGNIGATNVSRALGRKWAYFCFVLDVLKGLIPMLATMLIAEPDLAWRWAFGHIIRFVSCSLPECGWWSF